MDAKLDRVLLWPKNPGNPIREIKFDPREVTVITGWSQRGKSALIHIIDYCLGSEKCAIPIGKIRDSVEWFGVILHIPRGQLLLARRNPNEDVQSPEMVIRFERKKFTRIERPTNPESRESVIRQLNELAGLPPRDISPDESTFGGPPSFRDMAAFGFQPQHIIANPYTLFFKGDTTEHREKLIRSVLPYVLGSVDGTTLESQARLRKAEWEWRTAVDRLEMGRRAASMWLGKLQSFYSTAREYNLLAHAPEPEPGWQVEMYLGLLSGVADSLRRNPLPELPAGGTRRAARELADLRRESDRLIRTRDDLRRKLTKLEVVNGSVNAFGSALERQHERLLPVGWFAARIRAVDQCPICGNESNRAKKAIDDLATKAKEVSTAITLISSQDEAFAAEAMNLEKQIASIETELKRVETRLNAAEANNDKLRELRNRRDYLHDFSGEVRAALQGIREGSDLGALAKEEARLAGEVQKLRKDVDEKKIEHRRRMALESTSKTIGHYNHILGLEHAEKRWEIDDKNLTLKTLKRGERSDFLWEIGSAANWMGLHIAALLALHEHFRSVRHNPVPKFLILDQPSQAFFPEGVAKARIVRAGRKQSVDDDLHRLRRVFKALSSAVERTTFGLQIIVLEHADAAVWHGIKHIREMQIWRDDDALIPFSWK